MRLLGFILPSLIIVGSAHANTLIPHRAVYELSLDQASEASGIVGLTGRMVYELEGAPDTGYGVTFRFVTQIDTTEASNLTDQQTRTFEAGDGSSFSFSTRSFVNQNLESELVGKAAKADDSTQIVLTKPENREIDVEATKFPTQHLLELLEHARSGDSFYETTIFDGSDAADRVMTTTIVIGRQTQSDRKDPEFATLGKLENEPFWPVEMAYFDLSEGNGEEIPNYRIGFKLYESGVSRDLVMDYGDFSITGRLVGLDFSTEVETDDGK